MLQSKAMLATLSISAWTARKQDKAVSAEVERSHGAHDAGKYNKLLINKALLDPITKLAGQIREYHYFNTLAWADSGARLLPTKLFLEYTAKIRGFKEQFSKLVLAFKAEYPAEVQAARVRLGTMYNPGDYPEAWQLDDRFSVNLEFTPVPDAQDFRVDVSAEAQAELRDSVTKAVAARQADAVKATFARVRDVVSKISDRLSKDDPIFKDTLITNAENLCTVLDALNITNDPQITLVQDTILHSLIVSPADLRTSQTLRKDVARKAEEILGMLP